MNEENLEKKPVTRRRTTRKRKRPARKTVAAKKPEPMVVAQSTEDQPETKAYIDPILNAPGFPQPPSAIAEKMGTDRFPDRKVNIEEIDNYEWKDPTLLMKDGVPWVPEEHGYRARLCTREGRKHKGLDIWTKVYPEDNIRFQDSTYNISKAQGAKVHDAMFGEASDGIYRNGAFLCLAPLELAIGKEQRQTKDAKDLVDASMLESAKKIQNQTGGDPRDSRFEAGPKMARHTVRIPNEEMKERVNYERTGRKSVTVPAKIS